MRTITITLTVPDDVEVEVKKEGVGERVEDAWLKEWEKEATSFYLDFNLPYRLYNCLLNPARDERIYRKYGHERYARWEYDVKGRKIPHDFYAAVRGIVEGRLKFQGIGVKWREELARALNEREDQKLPYKNPDKQPFQQPEPEYVQIPDKNR